MVCQITSVSNIYSTVYSGADQRKHQSSAPLAFVRGIHRSPVNSSHKGPVTGKMFPFDDVIMGCLWTRRSRSIKRCILYCCTDSSEPYIDVRRRYENELIEWRILGHHWFYNGLSPIRRQAVIKLNDDSLLSESLGMNFSEIWIEIWIEKKASEKVVWRGHFLSASAC